MISRNDHRPRVDTPGVKIQRDQGIWMRLNPYLIGTVPLTAYTIIACLTGDIVSAVVFSIAPAGLGALAVTQRRADHR